MQLTASALWLVIVAWLLARAIRQRNVFGGVTLRRSAGRGDSAQAVQLPHLTLIVPARNESTNIQPCLAAILAQDYPADRLRVVVVDDHSTDDTAEIVQRLARTDARLVAVRAPPLPFGWTGKSHACWIGVTHASAASEWLCFLDADMRAHPLLLASAIEAAAAERLDLLSLAPRHELRSFAERLILPCGLYLLSFSQDLERIQAEDCADAVATGQFMLLLRAAYEDVGGHAAIREAICEDVALARCLKRRGYKVLMKDGSALLSTRMYTGWGTLWPGVAKNLSEMLGGPARTLAMALAALVLAWTAVLLPAADYLGCASGSSQACVALVPASLASAAVLALHLVGAVHFRVPIWYGLLFPLGYSAGALIALDSIRWRLTGRVRWKGRVYP
jgi:chlorobactene glucosyltransferase